MQDDDRLDLNGGTSRAF